MSIDPFLLKILELTEEIDKYVIFQKDDKGFYVTYAFKEGAPHDNRCLSWYFSYQPNARKRNGWTEQNLLDHKAYLEGKVGCLFRLIPFTCGGEEDHEDQIKRALKNHTSFNKKGPFIPEDHICKVGNPSKACRECHAYYWTYEEPIKCACWNLEETSIAELLEGTYSLSFKTLKALLSSTK